MNSDLSAKTLIDEVFRAKLREVKQNSKAESPETRVCKLEVALAETAASYEVARRELARARAQKARLGKSPGKGLLRSPARPRSAGQARIGGGAEEGLAKELARKSTLLIKAEQTISD